MLSRIALLGLSSAFCCTEAADIYNRIGQQAKRPELLDILGPSNLLSAKLDVLELAAPFESLIAPAFQLGILDGLENFVKVILETLTGLDELNNTDSDFFKDLDATSSLIQMLDNVHRTAKADNPDSDWHVTISKLLDDIENDVDQLPEKARGDASSMINELRGVSGEKGTVRQVSENMLEKTSSNLATQLLRVGNSFGPRAFNHILRQGGAGIFQLIHDDIRAVLGDPRTQAAPKDILDRISEIGTVAATQRDNMHSRRSFPLSLLDSWGRIISLPLEVLRALDRSRSELLSNVISTAAQRLNVLGITLPTRSNAPAANSGRPGGSQRSFRSSLTNSDETDTSTAPKTLLVRSAELLQNSAQVLAGSLLAPVSLLLSPVANLGRDAGTAIVLPDDLKHVDEDENLAHIDTTVSR